MLKVVFAYMNKVGVRYLLALLLLFSFAIGLVGSVSSVFAVGEPGLVGGDDVIGLKDQPTPITDIQATSDSNPTIPVRLYVSNGSLAFGSTTGLTFNGASSGSSISFSGSVNNVNAALATLTYTRGAVGTDTLEVSLVEDGEVFFSGNGNLYEYVSSTLTWGNARTAAAGRTKYGVGGYLTTITSQQENDFVSDRLENAGWMGASDSASEGVWRWVTGPENGTQFWSGGASGSAVNGEYENWNTGEPNDSGSNEDCGQFLAGSSGLWNDLPCSGSTLPGYVVEYGTPGNTPQVASLDVSITTKIAPDTPTNLGSASLVNGSWGNDTTPTLTFNLNDDEPGDELRYEIQIDDSSDFTSPVVDYTSGPKSQGSFNFFVGQAEGEGTSGVGSYNIGEEGQTLSEGSYYWRVKSIDVGGYESGYATANSGSIAFRIDTTAPTIPGSVSVTELTNDNTPEVSWAASTDSGAGLAAQAYALQWSQSEDFSGSTTTQTTGSTSLSPSSSLADGTWYFRVRTTDVLNQSSDYSSVARTVIDTEDPLVTALTPTDNNESASTKTDLAITFNDDISIGNGELRVFKESDDSLIESVDVTSGKVTGASTRTISVNTSSVLDYQTSYYVQIDNTAFNDVAGNSFAGIEDSITWNFTTAGTDFDQDGVPTPIEDAAPNAGDANDDGTLDSEQANVASFVSAVTGKYLTLATSPECVVTSASIAVDTSDENYSYPEGMLDFMLDCEQNGIEASIELLYYGVKNTESYTIRKLNPNTQQHSPISANRSQVTVDSSSALKISYTIRDGGELDANNVVDSIIKDPVGPAVNKAELANTGDNHSLWLALAVSVFIIPMLGIVAGSRADRTGMH